MEMEMEMGVCRRLLKCHTPRSRVERSCNCVDVNCVCSSPVSSRSEESWPGHKSYLPKMVRRELQKKYSQELQMRYTKLAHCHNASQILHQSHQTMAAREEARKQQRQELQMQYETVQKQKEEKKRADEATKEILKNVQLRISVAQKRKANCKKRQIEIKSQQLCELLKQQHELATLHNKKRLLLHFGWSPWLRLSLANRNSIVDAGNHYDDWLRKNAFESLHVQCVLGKAFLKRRARASAIRATQSRKRWQLSLCFQSWVKGQRADKSYRHSLLQHTCASFCEVLKHRKFLDQIGDERNCLHICRHFWVRWQQFVRDEKTFRTSLKFMENEQIAALHAHRAAYIRILQAWKEQVLKTQYEKHRTGQKVETWEKIHLWLHEQHHVEQNLL